MRSKVSFTRMAGWFLSALIVLSLLAAAVPQPALAATTADDDGNCSDTHDVEEGETLRRIAREYGIKLARLANANDIEKPYRITVGQELCIPNAPSLPSKATWTATFSGSQVKVVGAGFKKSSPFFVRVRESDVSAWYKLGKFATDKQGELEESFKVPSALSRVPALNICLKDGVTDLLVCKRVFRQ